MRIHRGYMTTAQRIAESTKVFKGFNRNMLNFGKHWELLPLMVIPVYATFLSTYAIYHTCTKAYNVRFKNKSDGQTGPHDSIRPRQRTKVFDSQPYIYKPIPELEAIKDELKTSSPKD